MRWFWPRSNWWLVLLVVAIVATVGAAGKLAVFDNHIYAWGMRFSASPEPSSRVAVVSIDPSIATSSDKLNKVLTGITSRLDAGSADVIGFVLPPDRLAAAGDFGNSPPMKLLQPANLADKNTTFLAAMASANNVVLAATVSSPADSGNNSGQAVEMPDSVALNSLPHFAEPSPSESGFLWSFIRPRASRVQLNLPPAPLALAAVGIGVLSHSTRMTGSEAAVLRTSGAFVPSFALEVAGRALQVNNLEIAGGRRRAVLLGNREVPTDSQLRLYPYFHRGGVAAFPVYPADSVMQGALPSDTFNNKIVLVGVIAREGVAGQVTPLGGKMTPVIYQANVISSIMKKTLYRTPVWGIWLSGGFLILIALYFIAIVPRIRHSTAVASSVVLALVLINTELLLIIGESLWLPLAVPVVALVLTHVILGSKRFVDSRITRFQQDLSETNRLLGQSYHEQGQLDPALERYRHCLPSTRLAAQYYDLGLSYESKRQFARAAGCFRAVREIEPDYLDIERRLKRLEDIEDRMVLGSAATQPVEGLIVANEGVSKPMLGRYSIEERIGRGSTGIVYLGKDPRIGRVVAIKTLSLGEDGDDASIAEAGQRFFREAKAAGRLSHPNIVTIHDVGEDQGVAYIAMDYLRGENLKSRCHRDNPLSFGDLMTIGAQVAEALGYAHDNQVVHRDIKPGNIVYNPDSGRVTVTDFGVAFMTDGNATRSAMVLGSPSYMSPEQVRGQPLDGRSDIFSLGITLFQLAAGQLPFNGQPIATLMYRIATEAHAGVQSVRPEVPTCLANIIDKTLRKAAADRYQTGAALARDLRICLHHWRKSTPAPAAEAENRQG